MEERCLQRHSVRLLPLTLTCRINPLAIRSIYVIVDNRTECLLKRRDQELQTGNWAALPPEEIPPFSKVEFGAFSPALFTACQGVTHFNVLVAGGTSSFGTSSIMRGDFTIKWDIPLVGYRSYHSWIPPPFSLESTCVGSARLTLTIFVLQPSAPKPASLDGDLELSPIQLHLGSNQRSLGCSLHDA